MKEEFKEKNEVLRPNYIGILNTEEMREITNPKNIRETTDPSDAISITINKKAGKKSVQTELTIDNQFYLEDLKEDLEEYPERLFFLNNEDFPSHLLGSPIAAFDKIVSFGIFSCLKRYFELHPDEYEDFSGAGITYSEIFHAMGRPLSQKLDSKMKEAIKRSCKRLGTIYIQVDWEEEAQALGIDQARVKRIHGNDCFVSEEFVYFIAMNLCKFIQPENGQESEGIYILKIPPLYIQAIETNHFSSAPREMTELSCFKKVSANLLVLMHYLAQKISTERYYKKIRNQESKTVYLVTETILKDCGIDFISNKSRYTKYIDQILNEYLEKGYINGYSVTKNGRSHRGFKVEI